MKIQILLLAGLLGLCASAPSAARAAANASTADAVKIVGYLVKIDVAADGKSAVATLVVKGKGKVAININDKLTLMKFKVKKIRTDDEIKCTYKEVDGKNLSTSFLRAAGC